MFLQQVLDFQLSFTIASLLGTQVSLLSKWRQYYLPSLQRGKKKKKPEGMGISIPGQQSCIYQNEHTAL